MIAISKYDLLQLSPQIAAPQIIETMADALLLVDPDGRVVRANAATGVAHERSTGAQKGLVCVRVMDTGCGIPNNERDHIFDAFFTTKPPGVGTGLGLSISLQIIEEYCGQIEVESLPGRGSAFTVRLPVVTAA